MRQIGALCCVIGCFFAAPAAGQERLWIRQFGTSGDDVANALCLDGVGGAFVAGGTPWGGDPWLARYDSAGSRKWIHQFAPDAFARALCPDGAGGAFLAGGGADWGANALLLRYDSDGNQLWLREFGTSGTEGAQAVCPDEAGGAFVAGVTDGSLGGPRLGGYDAWLSRYDGAGNQLWLRQFGTGDNDYAHALCADSAGGAFVAGLTGRIDGPTADRIADVWLARYDSAGNQTWMRRFGSGTRSFDSAWALCPDGSGGAFIAGETTGGLVGPVAGNGDAWLARYDSDGNRLWIRQFGTIDWDDAFALCPDGSDGAYVAGYTGFGLRASKGLSDAWLARYDSAGTQTWILQFRSGSADGASALCPDTSGGAFVAGYTYGRFGGPSAGESDAWLARYGDAACADCDEDGALTFFDFLCFQNLFGAGDPGADCDGDGTLTFFDFLCFQNAFAAGCP